MLNIQVFKFSDSTDVQDSLLHAYLLNSIAILVDTNEGIELNKGSFAD
jgi:hypothetical protein